MYCLALREYRKGHSIGRTYRKVQSGTSFRQVTFSGQILKRRNELGKLAKSYMDKGQLVPDSVTIDLLRSEVEKYKDPKEIYF